MQSCIVAVTSGSVISALVGEAVRGRQAVRGPTTANSAAAVLAGWAGCRQV